MRLHLDPDDQLGDRTPDPTASITARRLRGEMIISMTLVDRGDATELIAVHDRLPIEGVTFLAAAAVPSAREAGR